MEFDLLNQMLTSTVMTLFGTPKQHTQKFKDKKNTEKTQDKNSERKKKKLIIQQQNSIYNNMTPAQWVKEDGPKKLEESLKKLKLDLSKLKKSDLEKMNEVQLLEEKRRVKNQLKAYDNEYFKRFGVNPKKEEKEPFRPLYIYYKKLKQFLINTFPNQQNKQQIQSSIEQLKKRRKELRQKIEIYQKQFESTNNRKIRYVKDIEPIQHQYAEYKQIKTKILDLEKKLVQD